MNADRRRRIEAVALEALERTGAERAAYLDVACGEDEALRRDVDSLLGGHTEAAALLESPPWAAAPAPPLRPGTRLGPYEIDAVIGAGGMGEVYKGRDTRLGRTVAIKVLPPQLASDPERRRRFEHEARAASALNHPNICPLFDLGEALPSTPASPAPGAKSPAPGSSSPAPCPLALAPVHYLVLAYLEGQTLAERLKKGPLPVAQVMDLGAQMADALSAAHRAGIVHRDLKPANVMLTKAPAGANGPSGLQATLLDFGLAKLTGHGERPALDADGVTASASLTERGMVLGTVPYMAPEQVEGKGTDARTDLWALGAVLYEMLTGRRAFEGETPTKVAAAILEHEPAPVTSLQEQTPAALAHVIAKCLAKDPDARWDSAHDIADELRWIVQSCTADFAAPARPRRRDGRSAFLAGGALAGLMIGAGLMSLMRPARPFAPPTHVNLDVSPADELNAGGVRPFFLPTPGGSRTALAWAPDGQTLVFVGRRGGVQQIYARRLDAAEARPLAGTEGAQVPAVSADGQWVAFWAGGALRKVPLGGGPVTDVTSGVTFPPLGLVWHASGGLFFGRDDGRIWQVPPGGTPAAVTTVGEAESSHVLPCSLPGGRVLLYTVRKREWSGGDEAVVAHTLATGQRKVLLADAADARYVPTGHLVFVRRGTLFAVPFDAERVEVHGAPVAVLDTVVQALTAFNSFDVTGAGQFAVAPTGTLAWIPGPVTPYPDRVLVTLDRRGQITALPAPARSYGPQVRLSPDGRRLAVILQTLTEVGLWLYDFDRGMLTPLARGGEVLWQRWSPDGKRLVFRWLDDGRRSLAVQPEDGTAPPQVLLAPGVAPSSWTSDGRQLAALRGTDIVIVTVESGTVDAQPLMETAHAERWPEFSPDGRWLAYGSDVSGRDEVYVRPYPGHGPAEQVSVGGGESPAWHPNGRELFFVGRKPGGQWSMMAVGINAALPLRLGRPEPLFEFDPAELRFVCGPLRCYDVAPDGQRFFAVQQLPTPVRPPVTRIALILNWVDEVKAKVPIR